MATGAISRNIFKQHLLINHLPKFQKKFTKKILPQMLLLKLTINLFLNIISLARTQVRDPGPKAPLVSILIMCTVCNGDYAYESSYKGSLMVWALYAYFFDSQYADFELLVWCM